MTRGQAFCPPATAFNVRRFQLTSTGHEQVTRSLDLLTIDASEPRRPTAGYASVRRFEGHYSAEAVEKLVQGHAEVDTELERLLIVLAENSEPTMVNWSTQYLKNYRDALAHRIPLYIPPATYSEADAERFAANREELECIRAHDWERLNTLQGEQHELGTACAMFMHSFDDSERSMPLYLHPQMLADAKTVIETCTVYLAHWHERDGAHSE